MMFCHKAFLLDSKYLLYLTVFHSSEKYKTSTTFMPFFKKKFFFRSRNPTTQITLMFCHKAFLLGLKCLLCLTMTMP